MNILTQYPELAKQIEVLYQTRPDEILAWMIKTDNEYNKLRKERADASMVLMEVVSNIGSNKLFEKYSDTIYAQERYQLSVLYQKAVCDTLNLLKDNGIIQ